MSINVDTVIRCKLLELSPMLDFKGMDNTVVSMCNTDLKNYIAYAKENQMNIDNREEVVVPMVTGENLAVIIERFVSMADGFQLTDIEDDRKAVEAWVEWWFKKYQKRVKLVFNETPPKPTTPNDPQLLSKFTTFELDEMKKIMMYKLIKSGEIVGTKVLTDALMNRVMSQYSSKIEWNIGAKLTLMNTLLRETKRMAEVTGALIFIRPSKNSYGLREFRDSDVNIVK